MSFCGTGAGPVLLPEDLEAPSACCIGWAVYGAERCTCWEPVYDVDQVEPPGSKVAQAIRGRMCSDCAYRLDSPERAAGEDMESIATHGVFACHQGMRRVSSYRHPDGRVRAASSLDYQPLFVDDIAYRADGTPADLCAGWAALRRRWGLVADVVSIDDARVRV